MTLETRTTTCNRDCPDACSIDVVLEAGIAKKLKGNKQDSYTQGFLCPRTTKFLARQYASDRITQPLLKVENQLTPIDWEQALELIAKRFLTAKKKHGAESIFLLQGGGNMGLLNQTTRRFFQEFGPVLVKRGDVCSGPGEAAQTLDFGVADLSHPRDLLNSKLILCWGRDVHTTNTHLLPWIIQAKQQGAIIVNINPVGNKMSRLADLDIRIRPGYDSYLALALVRALDQEQALDSKSLTYCRNGEEFLALAYRQSLDVWIQEAHVSSPDFHDLLSLLKSHKPTATILGWGLTRKSNGGFTVRTIDGLAALSGNIGVAGGGVHYYHQRREKLVIPRRENCQEPSIPENRLGLSLLEKKPQCAWIAGYNPVTMLPDSANIQKALREIPFVVVVDTHPNDTTACADLILPTLTLLEDDNILGSYGAPYYRESTPALAPPQECLHEVEIINRLAQKMSNEVPQFPLNSIESWKDYVWNTLTKLGYPRNGKPLEDPVKPAVLFADKRFPTPSGCIELVTEWVPPKEASINDQSFILQASSHPDSQSSQWSVEAPEPTVTVHPSRGFSEGQKVLISSPLGSIEATVTLAEEVHPHIVWAPKGMGYIHGANWNSLVESKPTDLGGGTSLYEQVVTLQCISHD